LKYARLNVELLESRITPVVHSFSAANGVSDAPNAGGSPVANMTVRANLGGIPAPVVASGEHSQGVPFDFNHVPATPPGNLN
jgi:hypothetical protein